MKLLTRLWQKRRSSSSSHTTMIPRFYLREFKYEELKRATKDFSSEALQLGNGPFFVSVHLGVLPDSTLVAVKTLPNKFSDNFLTNIWTIKGKHHINLLRLIGYCNEGDNRRLLVFEHFPANRSLDLLLFEQPAEGVVTVLDWNRRYHIALGTARAVAHLHARPTVYRPVIDSRLLHGDIKPGNIILDSDFCPKVSGYGFPFLLGLDEYYEILLASISGGRKTTSYYVAPEVRRGRVLTPKSDAYSYGMVLFELVSGIRNCDNGETPESFPKRVASVIRAGVGHGDILSSILDGRLAGDHYNVDEEQVLRVCKVACSCVHDNTHFRPYMHQVVAVLEGVIDDDDHVNDFSSWI